MEMFSTTEIEFSYFDILSDSDVREGLKTFGEWPTYPQVLQQTSLLSSTELYILKCCMPIPVYKTDILCLLRSSIIVSWRNTHTIFNRDNSNGTRLYIIKKAACFNLNRPDTTRCCGPMYCMCINHYTFSSVLEPTYIIYCLISPGMVRW